MSVKISYELFQSDPPVGVRMARQESGVKWASRKDMVALCQHFGVMVTVPRALIAEYCELPDDQIHIAFREFGVKADGTTSSAIYVREVAWGAMLHLHHVPQAKVTEILATLSNSEFYDVAVPAVEFATKQNLKQLRNELYDVESRIHSRLDRLERSIADSASVRVEQPLDLNHLKKVLSEGWALLKKAEQGRGLT